MKLVKTLLASAMLVSTLGLATQASAEDKVYKVSISQIVEHPSLDASREGMIAGLKEQGFEEGKNLEINFSTAQGNPTIATQIARQFVGEGADVFVGIATPSAQALAANTKDTPIVFTAVSDPIGAKLVSAMQPTGNVTGLSDMSPIAQHLDLAKELLPNLKNFGVVYNPGEANSVALMAALKEEAKSRDITIVESVALKSSDVQSATRAIVTKSDIIYAMIDNTVASSVTGMIIAANQAGKPVLAASPAYVDQGALIGLGADYYDIGLQTADYVAALLQGKKVTELPVKIAEASDLVINKESAETLGITIPQSILDRAKVAE